MKKFIVVFLLSVFISACGTPENSADNDHPVGADLNEVSPGQTLYFNYCRTCHNAEEEQEQLAGINAATISAFIQSIPVMKTRLENELDEEQISLIADYICIRFPDDCNQNQEEFNGGNAELQADQFDFSYAADIEPIWSQNNNCNACHLNGVALGGFSLENGYDAIVNVASTQLPTMNQITPSDLDNSYLWLKMTNAHEAAGGNGDVMPTNGVINTTETKQDIDGNDVEIETLQIIQFWIENGAPQ